MTPLGEAAAVLSASGVDVDTLRIQLAQAAMQGLITVPGRTPSGIAEMAVRQADALIVQLAKSREVPDASA